MFIWHQCLDDTHCGVSYRIYRCRSNNVSGLFLCNAALFIMFLVCSFLTAYRLRSASIWAMRGSLYALGVVLIPLSHPESSMYAATLFITFLGLSIMFVFGLVMLSQSLPPEMAHASPDAHLRAYRLRRRTPVYVERLLDSNVPIQSQACMTPPCLLDSMFPS